MLDVFGIFSPAAVLNLIMLLLQISYLTDTFAIRSGRPSLE